VSDANSLSNSGVRPVMVIVSVTCPTRSEIFTVARWAVWQLDRFQYGSLEAPRPRGDAVHAPPALPTGRSDGGNQRAAASYT